MHFRKLCLTGALILFGMQTWTAAAPSLSIFDIPDSAGTTANGTNNRGDIVGVFDALQRPRPYLFRQNTVTTLDVPTTIAVPLGLNEPGQIVGYTAMNGAFTGFIWDRGTVTQISVPDANITYFHGINN